MSKMSSTGRHKIPGQISGILEDISRIRVGVDIGLGWWSPDTPGSGDDAELLVKKHD